MAHSITVIPNLSASSFTSRSLVAGVNLPTALRCSILRIPRLLSIGAMWRREGSQLSRTASYANVGSDLMLLIVEPDCVGWNGDLG